MTTSDAPPSVLADDLALDLGPRDSQPRAPLDAAHRHPWRDAATFLAVVYPAATAMALALPGTKEDPGPAAMLTAFVPALVVGLLRLVAHLRHGPADPHPLGLRRAGLRWWPAAVAIPTVAIGTSFAAVWAVGVVTFRDLGLYAADAPISLALMAILFLGEEIGWRSYLLPRLASVLPARRASLVTGFAQALFHLPLLLLTSGYDGDGSRWIVVPGVLTVITAAGAVFGWLRLRSGSLWPVAIAHAMVNVCLVEAPTLVSDDPDLTAYLTGEGGILTVLTVVAGAALVLRCAQWTPRTEAP